jgi:hypothetical protein
MKKIYLVLIIFFASTINAHAYFDPGTGSIIISALAAGLLTLKIYWGIFLEKIKKIFHKKKNDTKI